MQQNTKQTTVQLDYQLTALDLITAYEHHRNLHCTHSKKIPANVYFVQNTEQ